MNLYDVQFKINASVTGGDLVDRFNSKLNSVGKTADNVNRQMASLERTVKSMAGAFGVSQLAGLASEFARVTIQVDAYQKQLSVAFGGTSQVELNKLRDIMRDLGVAQDEALGSAVRFTSAMKLSGMTMEQTNTAFAAASKLILSNKLSADGANRVYYALAQTASKGKLQSEELNGQLGDVLAGFTQQVAIATGRGQGLSKAMADGKVSADEFFKALIKIGGGIDPESLDSAARALSNLKNAWFDFKTDTFDPGAIKEALDLTTIGIKALHENAGTLIAAMGIGLSVAMGKATAQFAGQTLASMALARNNNLAASSAVQLARTDLELAQQQLRAAQTAREAALAEGQFGLAAQSAAYKVVEADLAVAAANKNLRAAELQFGQTGGKLGLLGRGFSGLIGILGGPWGIALAGATYLLGEFGQQMYERHALFQQINADFEENQRQLRIMNGLTGEANSQSGAYGQTVRDTAPGIEALSGKIRTLATELYNQADAAKRARIETAKLALDQAHESEKQAMMQMPGMRWNPLNYESGGGFNPRNWGQTLRDSAGGISNFFSGGANDRDAAQAYQRAFQNTQDAKKRLENAYQSPNGDPMDRPATGGGGSGTGSKKEIPLDSAGNTAAASIAQLRGELAALDMFGEKVGKAHKALAEWQTGPDGLKGFNDQSDGRKKAYIAEMALLDDLEAKMAAKKNVAQDFMSFGRDKAQSDFDLKHWDEFAGKVGKSHMALFEFNLEQGRYGDKSSDAVKTLKAEAEAADAVALALIRKSEMQKLATDKAAWAQESEALRDQALAVEMSSFAFKQLEDRKRRLAEIEREASVLTGEGAAEHRAAAIAALDEAQALERLNHARETSFLGGTRQAIHNYAEEIGNMGKDAMNLWTDALKGTEDALVQFCMTGKLSFKDMANSIIADLIRIAIRQSIVGAITKGLGAIFGGVGAGAPMSLNAGQQALTGTGAFGGLAAANGAAFDLGGTRQFAQGGIVSSPTFFRYGGGIGQMGEAGPEAIVPLKRMNNGRLGVEMHGGKGGGGNQSVVVNVNVEGGTQQSQGDPGRAAELGKVVANVVRSELIQQKRPGGLLAA